MFCNKSKISNAIFSPISVNFPFLYSLSGFPKFSRGTERENWPEMGKFPNILKEYLVMYLQIGQVRFPCGLILFRSQIQKHFDVWALTDDL